MYGAYLNSWQDVLKYVEEQKKDFALPNQKIVIELLLAVMQKFLLFLSGFIKRAIDNYRKFSSYLTTSLRK